MVKGASLRSGPRERETLLTLSVMSPRGKPEAQVQHPRPAYPGPQTPEAATVRREHTKGSGPRGRPGGRIHHSRAQQV